jgi:hypothetical protein
MISRPPATTSPHFPNPLGDNTGPGNLSIAFVGVPRMASTIERVNTMDPEEVYTHLSAHLPYDETRDYIKKGRDGKSLYKDWEENKPPTPKATQIPVGPLRPTHSSLPFSWCPPERASIRAMFFTSCSRAAPDPR